jgi:outer membrane protein assembly factor BamD (BamD/ComL family)
LRPAALRSDARATRSPSWATLRRTPALLALVLAACASGDGIRRAKPMDPERVPETLAEAEATLALGDEAPLDDLEESVARLRQARVTEGLEPEVRQGVQTTFEQAADELVRRGQNPKVLRDLIESELPMRFAARAGVRAAELLFARGDRIKAFKTIRSLDTRYPTHTQRDQASKLLSEVGMDLADDKGRYLLFFKYASLAPQVLEYLALQYPTHPETDDALARLALIYEEDRLWSDAIVKHQELVLWAPGSPFRSASEAAIPRLRLASMKRPDYARDNLLLARDELVRWLGSHPTHELRPEVERMLVDARQRLADNDLIVARFYLEVESAAGVRLHALRAEAEARLAGNLDQVAEAADLLARAIDIPGRVEVEPETEAGTVPQPDGATRPDVFLEGSGQ